MEIELNGYIKDRTVWNSEDLDADNSWIHRLSDNEIEDIDNALEKINAESIDISDISKETFHLELLAEKLLTIQECIEHDRGIFFIKGLPIEKYSNEDIQRVFVGINSYIGTAVIQSTDGALIHEVKDKGEGLYGEKGRGTNTKDRLPWHTDRSDVVSLLCISPAAQGGESMIASLTNLYNRIKKERPDLADVLCNPFCHARAPFEFEGLSPWYELPIFTMRGGRFAARYLRHFINISQDIVGVPKLSDLQIEALDYVDQRLCDPDVYVKLAFEPGDIQIINNFTTVHSREEYADDSNQFRYLLRLWLSVPNSRELIEQFSELYGDTKAGAVRGGILPAPANESGVNSNVA